MVRWDPDLLKVDARSHHPTIPELVVDIDDLHAGSVPRYHHDCQRFACSFGRVGPADDGVEMGSFAMPARTIGGVVFLPGDNPCIPIATGEGLHPRFSISGVEICTTTHLSKGECSEQFPIRVLTEGLEEQRALGRITELNDGPESHSTGQQRREDIDIHACQFLGSKGKIHQSEARSSIGHGNERLREPGSGHFAERRARGIKRLSWISNRIELRGNRSQYSLGKGAGTVLECALFRAKCKVDWHMSFLSLSVLPPSSSNKQDSETTQFGEKQHYETNRENDRETTPSIGSRTVSVKLNSFSCHQSSQLP